MHYGDYQNKEYLRSRETTEQRQEVKDMAKPNVLLTKHRFRVSALLGILLLVIGVSLLGYSISAIQDHEQLSNIADLALEQLWNYDGSLRWWRNVYVTLFLPLTAAFLTLGGVVLVSQPFLTRLRHKRVV